MINFQFPTLKDIDDARISLEGRIVRTPFVELNSARLTSIFPKKSQIFMKLELFQQSGSFKARGVLLGVDKLSDNDKKNGVVAASGGNHALAVSWATNALSVPATIFMPDATDPLRVQGCRDLGANVIQLPTIGDAFLAMEQMAKDKGVHIMHPFEAEHMSLGAATCGAEFIQDCPDCDVFVLPVGGGGLISGMSAAIKMVNPGVQIIGVEPYGADSMYQSFLENRPVAIDQVSTIADSLGAPSAMPYSYALSKKYVDKIVRVRDAELVSAMKHIYNGLKIVAEPACAASLAAICSPLKKELFGKKIGILACGSNISLARYLELTS